MPRSYVCRLMFLSTRPLSGLLVPLLTAVVFGLAAAPSGASAAPRGGDGVVSASKVGPLRIDSSTEADVLAFAGQPDERVIDTTANGSNAVLGYFCRSRRRCQTYYEVDLATSKLSHFRTASRRYRTPRGTRVGMRRRAAERRERRRAREDCFGYTIFKQQGRWSLIVGFGFQGRRVTWLAADGPYRGPFFSC